jgi:hypothetical protein
MFKLKSDSLKKRASLLALIAAFSVLLPLATFAQTTVGTGSIVGTVTDPQGAVVDNARITITNAATGQTVSVTSNGSGAFNSGALTPGDYKVQVSAKVSAA